MIEMVRIPSETPNISNIDDFVGLRYAYGNQNGYVIDKGNECSYTINGSIFKINSGRLVLQGVECDIDANGVELTIDNISTKRYYVIYLQINLALNTTKILMAYNTSEYPIIDNGDDLTLNTIGVANMVLYTFEATNGVISDVKKIVPKIEYTGTALSDYDISKGTVEERLTNLGFKQGSITKASGVTATSINFLKRQGNYVIGKWQSFNINMSDVVNNIIGNVPNDFLPKNDEEIKVAFESATFSSSITSIYYGTLTIKILTNGKIQLYDFVGTEYSKFSGDTTYSKTYPVTGIDRLNFTSIANINITFGYEAKPI